MTSKIRNGLIIFSFLLLSMTIIGIFWLVTTPNATAGLIFSYAAGIIINGELLSIGGTPETELKYFLDKRKLM